LEAVREGVERLYEGIGRTELKNELVIGSIKFCIEERKREGTIIISSRQCDH